VPVPTVAPGGIRRELVRGDLVGSGRRLDDAVVQVDGERITWVGPAGSWPGPAGDLPRPAPG
jgi:hypothetical protein